MAVAGSSDLKIRTLVGGIAAAVALAALLVGGWALWGFVTIVALVALAEWCGLASVGVARTGIVLALLAIVMIVTSPVSWGAERDTVASLAMAGIIAAMFVGSGRAGWGILYAGLPAIGLLFLRGLPQGFGLALWTVLIVIVTDTGAYFAGRAIGGPKLSPRLSPKKTWAGLAGGMIAALLIGAAVGAMFDLPRATLWLGAPLAVLAQIGDLYESALKRKAGVKDSGRLLPGHGGVLDRIDGLVPVVILVAALAAGYVL